MTRKSVFDTTFSHRTSITTQQHPNRTLWPIWTRLSPRRRTPRSRGRVAGCSGAPGRGHETESFLADAGARVDVGAPNNAWLRLACAPIRQSGPIVTPLPDKHERTDATAGANRCAGLATNRVMFFSTGSPVWGVLESIDWRDISRRAPATSAVKRQWAANSRTHHREYGPWFDQVNTVS